MPELRTYRRASGSCPFDDRLDRVADVRAAARIVAALRKLERGLRPNLRSVGEGVHEARIDYGPGYRIYFGEDGGETVVLLLCGDKRTQAEDILFARVLWTEYKGRKRL